RHVYTHHRASFPTRRSSDLAHAEGLRIADLDGGQLGLGIDAQQGHVRALVRADELGLELALVRQGDVDLVGAVHHVVIGQDVPVDRKSTRLNSSHVKISYAV